MGETEEKSYSSEMNEMERGMAGRRQEARARVKHQVELARSMGKSVDDLVEELVSIFDLDFSEPKRKWIQLPLWNQSKLDQL